MQQNILSTRDELIVAIYAAAASAVPSSRPLELLTAMTRSDKAFVARFNFEERRGSMLATFNVEPNFADTYATIFSPENPWLARTSYFQAEGLVWRGSDIVEHGRLADTNFYKLFMHGQLMEKTAHLVIRVRGSDVVHVMLTRRPQSEEFDDEAIELCQLFARHSRQALEISGAVGAQRFMDQGFVTAIEELSAGIALVELPATVRFMNDHCHTLFAATTDSGTTGRRWGMGSPVGGRSPITPRLPRPLAEALAKRPVPRSCIIEHGVGDGRRPIFVEIRPYKFGNDADGQLRQGYAIICRSSDAAIEVDEANLRAAFQLTASEARVCAALVAGENIEQMAVRLEISPQTVRTHVKHVFEKTYTARQSELVKMLVLVARRRLPKLAPEIDAAPRIASNVWPSARPSSNGAGG